MELLLLARSLYPIYWICIYADRGSSSHIWSGLRDSSRSYPTAWFAIALSAHSNSVQPLLLPAAGLSEDARFILGDKTGSIMKTDTSQHCHLRCQDVHFATCPPHGLCLSPRVQDVLLWTRESLFVHQETLFSFTENCRPKLQSGAITSILTRGGKPECRTLF